MSDDYVEGIGVRATLDKNGRKMVRIEIIEDETGKVLGSGLIPIYACGNGDCEGCGEDHGRGQG